MALFVQFDAEGNVKPTKANREQFASNNVSFHSVFAFHSGSIQKFEWKHSASSFTVELMVKLKDALLWSKVQFTFIVFFSLST